MKQFLNNKKSGIFLITGLLIKNYRPDWYQKYEKEYYGKYMEKNEIDPPSDSAYRLTQHK
jgi:hypothetical protein